MPNYTDIERREIFHFCFLEQLLRISDPKLYIVKGGVNLRFFFKSPRYSEDMDIDVLAGNVLTLKKNGYKILKDAGFKRSLQSYGIAELILNDPNKAKQTETTQRFRLQLINDAGDSLPTKVEFSRRDNKQLHSSLEKINLNIARSYGRLSYLCFHYTGESAVIQKLLALAGRDITQARDVFDLHILHSGGHLQSTDLRSLLPGKAAIKTKENLLSLTYADFKGQVLEFLDEEHRGEYKSESVWVSMKETVLRILSHAK